MVQHREGRGAPGLQPVKEAEDALVAFALEETGIQVVGHHRGQGGGDAALLHIGAEGAAVDQVPGLVAGFDDQKHVHAAQFGFLKPVFGVGFDVLAVEVVDGLNGHEAAVVAVEGQVAPGQGVGGVHGEEAGVVIDPTEVIV